MSGRYETFLACAPPIVNTASVPQPGDRVQMPRADAAGPLVRAGQVCHDCEMTREFQVTFDAADPLGLGNFWCEVLGYVRETPPDRDTWDEQLEFWGVPRSEWNSRNVIVDPEGKGPRIFIQRVPEGKLGKNRLHLDVRSFSDLRGDARMEALRAEASRLVALGAETVEEFPPSDFDIGWIVMRDPEGNEFCLD